MAVGHAIAYFVLVAQHTEGVAVHIVPTLAPRLPCKARPLTVRGPFPTLIRALNAQRRMAEEWRCNGLPPDRDTFVHQYWNTEHWLEGR